MILAIFCGTSLGRDAAYADAAREFGRLLAEEGIEVVYGGGCVGLMGAVADAALLAGGRVTGVMPRALVEREIAHAGLTTLHIVETMHERKTRMAELASGFVVLPGGPGTLEEIFEQWTWGQLGIHKKPCGFLDVRGYFEPLRLMVAQMVAEGFMDAAYAEMLAFADNPRDLLTRFRDYQPPRPKWAPGGVEGSVRR